MNEEFLLLSNSAEKLEAVIAKNLQGIAGE
jgi:hypothetical protein